MRYQPFLRKFAPFLIPAFIAGVLVGFLVSICVSSKSPPEEARSFSDAARRIMPAVVHVVPTRDLARHSNAIGSGLIISAEGWALTNAHVVDDKNLLYSVILNDERTYQVSEVVFAESSDLALLHLQDFNGEAPTDLPAVHLGDSDQLEAGQQVVAIGTSPNTFTHTVTTGIISALNRSITAGGFAGSRDLIHLIQTDAGTQPGSSGGPLINQAGEVIGLITAIATDGEDDCFSIPSNDIRRFLSKQLAL